jgi:hypothetical protein
MPEPLVHDEETRRLLLEALMEVGKLHNLREGEAMFEEFRGQESKLCKKVFGARLWAAQREIMQQLSTRRFVTVRSGRKAGKTETGALAVLAFLYTSKCVVLTTAPTGRQVRDVLWQRIGSMWSKAKTKWPALPGELGTIRLTVAPEHYALGISTNSPDRFQGWHAGVRLPDEIEGEEQDAEGVDVERLKREAEIGDKRLVVIIDEAAGVDDAVYRAIEGSLSGPNVHVLLTANPTIDAESDHFFARSFRNASRWHRIRISACADDVPDPVPYDSFHVAPDWLADKEWVEQMRAEWGTDSPLWSAYVLGKFPQQSLERRFVTKGMLIAAADSALPEVTSAGQLHLGVDVARQGSDESVATLWANGVLKEQISWRLPDLMATAAKIVELAKTWGHKGESIPARNIHIDAVGMGAGVVDRLKQLGYYVDSVDFGASAKYDWRELTGQMVFSDRKSELHWVAKRLLEERKIAIPPKFAELWRQAQWARYEFEDSAKGTRVALHREDSKDGLRERYGRSPDQWDSAIIGLSRGASVKPGFMVQPRSTMSVFRRGR